MMKNRRNDLKNYVFVCFFGDNLIKSHQPKRLIKIFWIHLIWTKMILAKIIYNSWQCHTCITPLPMTNTFFEDIGSQRPNLLACHNPYQPHEIDPPQIGAWMLQRHRPQEVSVLFWGLGEKSSNKSMESTMIMNMKYLNMNDNHVRQ